MTKSLRTLQGLLEHGLIKKEELASLQPVIETFSLAISPQMLALMDKNNPNDPIAKQFVPSVEELSTTTHEQEDPIGDVTHQPVKGIVHRYPDRCLFMPVQVCPVYCRFCFRREKVGHATATLTPQEMTDAYAYIASCPDIWEVILTGGDPLILKPLVLKNIIQTLAEMPHVNVIRIHTRVPVVEPTRIQAQMISALKCSKPVYIVLHANHPTEFSAAAVAACNSLVDAGIPLLSQTVLLKGLNDNIETLSKLMRCFVSNRIKPYYLHHGDLAKGTKHFRTSIAHGQALVKQLRGRFSGLCQPVYVLDIPGGYGKMPIGPQYLTQDPTANYQVEDYLGAMHQYDDDHH